MNAFYYDGEYYLLPEGYNTASDLKRKIYANQSLDLMHLDRTHCMAPYFIKEDLKETTLTITDVSEIYAANVVLLDKEEYSSRLNKLAKEYCTDCPRFKNNKADLETELTLDGMCYEDEGDFNDSFRDMVIGFWEYFCENLERFQAATDNEDRSIEAEIKEKLSFIPEVFVACSKYKDRYVLMLSGLFDQARSLMCDYICDMSPEKADENWDFYPYVVQNIYKYRPLNDNYNVLKHAPRIKYERTVADRPRFDVTIKIKPCDDENVDSFRENLLYVFSVMGENRFYAALKSLNCDSDYDNQTGYEHIKEFSVAVQKDYMQNLRMYFRRFHYGEFKVGKNHSSGRRKDDQLMTTNCDLISHSLLSQNFRALSSLDPRLGRIGTLCFDFKCTIREYTSKLRPIHDAIEKQLFDPGYIIPVGMSYGTQKVCFDFILADVNKGRKAIRELTPLLKHFNTSYTETTASGSNTYVADYELGCHEA